MELRENRKTVLSYLFIILLSAALVRLVFGVFFFNRYDTFWYRTWILDFKNGFFPIYSRADDIVLDYPPLFLVLVYPISLLYRVVPPDTYEMADMLFMKLIPIIFDVACGWILYFFCSKHGNSRLGLFAAAVWCANPSMFFNCSVWGQTDSVMAFLLFLVFMLLYDKKYAWGTLAFAAACMIKFQCLFFMPVYLLALLGGLDEKPSVIIKRILACAGIACAAVFIVFLPFTVGAKNPMLLFDVYLGSGGKYPYYTLNAFNIYGIFALNWVKYEEITFLGTTLSTFGWIVTVLGVIGVAALWIFGKKRCVFVASLLLMQHIFMFMPSMHERYQIIVVPFALAAYIIHRRQSFLWLFASLSAITLFNQFIVLANVIRKDLPWQGHYGTIMSVGSVVNFVIFLITAAVCIRFFTEKTKE